MGKGVPSLLESFSELNMVGKPPETERRAAKLLALREWVSFLRRAKFKWWLSSLEVKNCGFSEQISGQKYHVFTLALFLRLPRNFQKAIKYLISCGNSKYRSRTAVSYFLPATLSLMIANTSNALYFNLRFVFHEHPLYIELDISLNLLYELLKGEFCSQNGS